MDGLHRRVMKGREPLLPRLMVILVSLFWNQSAVWPSAAKIPFGARGDGGNRRLSFGAALQQKGDSIDGRLLASA
jgi:hypothetical protein